MLFWTTVKICLKSLLANKTRSLLTMLGIIIGVGAVISMMAIGAGARKQVMDRITAMGSNLLFVRPTQINAGGVRSVDKQNIKPTDGLTLLAEVPEIVRLSPIVNGGAQVKYGEKNTRTNIQGVAPAYFQLRNYQVERGRRFTDAEVENMVHVCAIGTKTAGDLFDQDDPLNQVIRINNVGFRIIGVLKSKGDQGWANWDDLIIAPYTVAMRELFGIQYVQELHVQVAEGADAASVQAKITAVMRRLHRLQSDQQDDFLIRSQIDWMKTAMEASRTFTVLLGGIASISLLVGGIGIMNIMLVTVTERTKEIGIRKAIGARERSILLQFLLEALIISGLGGLTGVILGVGGAIALRRLTDFTTLIEPTSVLLSLSVAGFIGVFFGFYPARRAALLDPVEALRYE